MCVLGEAWGGRGGCGRGGRGKRGVSSQAICDIILYIYLIMDFL